MGSIYKRGKTYWIKYYKNGKSYRESSGSDKKMVAKNKLALREGEIAEGKTPGIQFEKVTFDELAEDMLQDYKNNHKKSLNRAEISVTHLKKSFEGEKVVNITSKTINSYIEKRKEVDGVKNATINRELSALKRMLNLGAEQNPPLVNRVPKIRMLEENNVREGFFEHDQFLSLKKHLPEYLKGVATIAYKTGLRVSEIGNLKWSQVDLKLGFFRLEAGDTKNNEPRTIYLDSEMKAIFKLCWSNRKNVLPYVFLNRTGKDRIKRFDKAWKNACKEAKVNLKYFHDFRRTAVRNMVRSGVPDGVAMKISGHKTRSVFDRYNIVNDADLKLAAEKHQEYLDSRTGTNSGTIHQIDEKRHAGNKT
jgi:integrase